MSRAIKGTDYNDAVKELHDLGVGLNVVKEGWGKNNILMYAATIRLFNILYPGAACLMPMGAMRSINLLKLHNDCLVSADPCECLADPESHQLMDDVEAKLKGKNT